VTFAEAAAAYIAQHQGGWSADSVRAWRLSLKRDSASIAQLCVGEIALDHVKRVVQPLVDQGLHVSARRTQGRIQALLNYSVEHGWRAEDKRSVWSPIAPRRKKAEQHHHRAVDWNEMPGIVARLRASVTMSARLIEFLILTATRSSEAREAKWSEISFKSATWTIPPERTKTGKPHSVPLSDRALAILEELAKRKIGDDVVFSGRFAGRPLSRVTLWTQCDRFTDSRATPHGFRSSFRDWCGDNSVPRELAEMALAHAVGSKVEAAYARSSLLERRRPVMRDWAHFLDGKERAEPTIVPLRRA
jgi:integrase